MNTLRDLLIKNGFKIISESSHLLWATTTERDIVIQKAQSVGVSYKITIHTRGICTTTEYRHNLTGTKRYLVNDIGLIDLPGCNEEQDILNLLEEACEARTQELELFIHDLAPNDYIGNATLNTRKNEVGVILNLVRNLHKQKILSTLKKEELTK